MRTDDVSDASQQIPPQTPSGATKPPHPPSDIAKSPRPPALDDNLIEALRRDLEAAHFTVDYVDSLLSQQAQNALMRDQRVPAMVELQRLIDGESAGNAAAAATLAQLFILGMDVDYDRVDAALPALGSAGACALGLIAPAGASANAAETSGADANANANAAETGNPAGNAGETSSDVESVAAPMRALFDLRPHAATLPDGDHHWWVLSDLGEATTGRPLAPDHVLGIGGATTTLLTLTDRTPVDSALDVGTGCGIQALYLATHCTRVVATDLSERACEITRFNAALNQVAIDVRCGSLFEPVAGERFNLIVSNPPFVITPDSVRASGLMQYRDGGAQRDHLIAQIIHEAPDHLTEGGTIQMLANWEVDSDSTATWSDHPRSWFDGLPVDAWVIQRDCLEPAQYVEMWLRDSGGTLTARDTFERAYADWLADFTAAGVQSIGMGLIAARRRPDFAEKGPSADGGSSIDEGDVAASPSSANGNEPDRATQRRPAYVECDGVATGHVPTGRDIRRGLDIIQLVATRAGGGKIYGSSDSGGSVEGDSTDGGSADLLWDLHAVCSPDVTQVRYFAPGEADPQVIELQQGGGVGLKTSVSSELAGLVGAADGELTLGQIVAAIAALMELDPGDLRNRLSPEVIRLLKFGILRTSSQDTP